ncbi:hypothetical protein GCK72_007436 [Caenorhabditis remanei]|uniref:F-box domain-containing protein n=1 Tax=Caenorhabditis remanei TaxID=31234 RepID=A0A6A5HM11_CAERE|nr:hypothetical protein GCK72_007436 [Caenorhabditis remanei]KAF1767477.1 hypothetical protein GCK72_007436 [Caenorhabditis remanei]
MTSSRKQLYEKTDMKMTENSAAILEELRSIREENQESFKKLTEEMEEMKKKQSLQVEMMEKIIEKLEKMAVKTESVDFKIMEKWNEFPPEIKMECISRMDFETRLNLRRTARAERSLVDSRLYPMDNVYMCNGGIEVEDDTDYFIHETDKCAHNKQTSSCGSKLLVYILKHGLIEHLYVFLPREKIDKWVEELKNSQIDTIRVKRLTFHSTGEKLTEFFLNKVNKEMLESIEVLCRNDVTGYTDTEAFLKSPTVINVKRLLILRQFNTVLVFDFIMRWIKHDVQIGQKHFCHTLYPTVFLDFFTLFGDRVVKSEDNYIRIRTDNESKHILIRLLPCKKHAQSLSCHVIPAEQTIIEKEDDYYTSYDLSHYDETDDDYDDDDTDYFDDDSDEEDSDVEDYDFDDEELDDEEDEKLDYVQ